MEGSVYRKTHVNVPEDITDLNANSVSTGNYKVNTGKFSEERISLSRCRRGDTL